MLIMTPWAQKKLPVRKEDEHPMYSLQREMNRLFDEFFCSSPFDSLGGLPTVAGEQMWGELSPRIDMSENDKALLVKVELQGISDKDVQISLNHDLLTISGEKKQEKEQSEKGWYRMERQYGSFSRSIPLPFEVVSDKTEAVYKDGILTITLPKSPSQQKATKSISVKCG